MDQYDCIFKRKSFHIFKNKDILKHEELNNILTYLSNVKRLDDSINIDMNIVRAQETSCKNGADYCIEFYSEIKGDYLRNIGYVAEQVDLYLSSLNIGAVWLGVGKPDVEIFHGLHFIIMIVFAKVNQNSFRKDMFKAKRKSLDMIWEGDTINIANIVRFTPSACNSQPWFVKNENHILSIYRYKKQGRVGLIPQNKVSYLNSIDIGIFLYILETCLQHERYTFERHLFSDNDQGEYILNARYVLK